MTQDTQISLISRPLNPEYEATLPCLGRQFSKSVAPQDFPGGPVVKNLPCNARDASSIPGWGTKIPYAMKQLSPPATTTESRDSVCHN